MKMHKLMILIIFMLIATKVFTINVNAATQIELGKPVTGMQNNNEEYSFEINADKAGRLIINYYLETEATQGNFYYTLDDVSSASSGWDAINGKFQYSLNEYVEKGQYVFTIKSSVAGSYKMETKFETIPETFPDTKEGLNNTVSSSNLIQLENEYYGLIMSGDTDVYKFSLNDKTNITINTVGHANSGWFRYRVYDEKLNEVINEMLSHFNKNYGGTGKFTKEYELESGVYYIVYSAMDTNLGGPYSFEILNTKKVEEEPSLENNFVPEVPSDSETNKPKDEIPKVEDEKEQDSEIEDSTILEDTIQVVPDAEDNSGDPLPNQEKQDNNVIPMIIGVIIGICFGASVVIFSKLIIKKFKSKIK
ncbi:MAG: hypothetical protein IJO63_03950 [Bacilli bacterium]|nr:hypothetical protein [Bacilli bacterium]